MEPQSPVTVNSLTSAASLSWVVQINKSETQCSDVMSIGGLPQLKWQMRFDWSYSNRHTARFQLCLLSGLQHNTVNVHGTVSVPEMGQQRHFHGNHQYQYQPHTFNSRFTKKQSCHTIQDWFNVAFMQGAFQGKNTITIQCDLNLSYEGKIVSDSKQPLPVASFLSPYKQFLMDSFLSDVQLIVGEQTLPAHKLVLAARSPVFRAMFAANLKESLTNTVNIDDVSPNIMKTFLSFMYTGKIEDSRLSEADAAVSLFVVSNKYQVDALIQITANWLHKNLSLENALQVAQLSDLHCHVTLRRGCLTFFARNVDKLSERTDWPTFLQQHPKFVTEVVKIMHSAATQQNPNYLDSHAKMEVTEVTENLEYNEYNY